MFFKDEKKLTNSDDVVAIFSFNSLALATIGRSNLGNFGFLITDSITWSACCLYDFREYFQNERSSWRKGQNQQWY